MPNKLIECRNGNCNKVTKLVDHAAISNTRAEIIETYMKTVVVIVPMKSRLTDARVENF